jgi:hypothetical protein
MKKLHVCEPTYFNDSKGRPLCILADAVNFDDAVENAAICTMNDDGALDIVSHLCFETGEVYEIMVRILQRAWITAIEKDLDSHDEPA